MTDSSPEIPASTFALLRSPAAAQVLSSDSWPVYRYQGAKIIAAYLSCHDLQDLLNIIKALDQPIRQYHARGVTGVYTRHVTFAKVVQHLETYRPRTGPENKELSDLDLGADYLCAVWALASEDTKIAARFEVKGSLKSVRSFHKMWSLQSWIRHNKLWFSRDVLPVNYRIHTLWLDEDEEELKQAEGDLGYSQGVSHEPLKTIPIIWDINHAAEEFRASNLKLDSIKDMIWEYFRDEVRRCFPLETRSQNIDKIYLHQHSPSTNVTTTELLPDHWTDQRTTLSNRGPYTTTLFFTSKKVSSAELRDSFWETWSSVMEPWARAIAEERELELEGIEDPKERQKRMQPRECPAELQARLKKYRLRHLGSRVGLEMEGTSRGKRMREMAVDEVADEGVIDSKRKRSDEPTCRRRSL